MREGLFHAQIMEAKTLDTDDKLFIEGWASTKDIDRDDEIIEPEAFADGITNFLKNPILLYQHNPSVPIGKVTEMSIKPEEGFWIKGFLSKAKDVESIATKIKEGILRAFSVGFRVPENGWKLIGDIGHITKLELWEVSVVSIPANQDALFSVAKGFAWGSDIIVPEKFIDEKIEAKAKETIEKIKEMGGIKVNVNLKPEAGETGPPAPGEYKEFLAVLQDVKAALLSEREQEDMKTLQNLIAKSKRKR